MLPKEIPPVRICYKEKNPGLAGNFCIQKTTRVLFFVPLYKFLCILKLCALFCDILPYGSLKVSRRKHEKKSNVVCVRGRPCGLYGA